MKLRLYICIIMLLGLAVSCNDEESVNTEESSINSFITLVMGTDTSYVLSNKDGANYIMMFPGDTATAIEKGDSVYIWYAARMLTSSNYYSTNIKEIAIADGLDTSRVFEPLKFIVGKSGLVKGVDIGISLMHNKDVGILVFSSGLGYGNTNIGLIPPETPLCFSIEVIKHIKKQE